MARWQEISDAHPEFAARVQKAFDAHKHKVLATLRTDGSPRVSGIEAIFRNGDLWLGMMAASRKAMDLRRDPRLALHSATADHEMTLGDAKFTGTAEEVDATHWNVVRPEETPPDGAHLFRVDVREVTLTRIGDPADHLVIEIWTPAHGLRRFERA
jgi:hypothetical protein